MPNTNAHRLTISPDDPRRRIGQADVMRLIGRSRSTIWRWTKAGILPPPAIIRRHPYWRLGDVLEALDRAGMDDATAGPPDAA